VSGNRRDSGLYIEAFVKQREADACQRCEIGSKGVEKMTGDA
jgi:hypothetical protein